MDFRRLLSLASSAHLVMLAALLSALLSSDGGVAGSGCPYGRGVRSEVLELGSATGEQHGYHSRFRRSMQCLKRPYSYRRRERDQTEVDPRCRHLLQDPFRTFDGVCNNLYNADWGTAMAEFRRLMSPVYDDGKEWPRTMGWRGTRLPSAREVSLACHPHANSPLDEDRDHSLLLMAWAQFLDHDITGTLEAEPESMLTCCSLMNNNHLQQETAKPCFPIRVPPNDRHFKRNCLEFMRSVPSKERLEEGETREQVNALTSLVDASMIYGSTDEESDALRTHFGGLMKSSGETCEMPPVDERFFCVISPEFGCLAAGDKRVNEVPPLTAMHVLGLRHHNKLARVLRYLNPHWDDQQLFQAARKINTAIVQQIQFYEWLPPVLGKRGMALAGLNRPYRYDDRLDPTILNEFATVAYRFGHSLLPPQFKTYKSDTDDLSTMFFKPNLLGDCTTGVDALISGLLEHYIHKVDTRMTDKVTDLLFFNVSGTGESTDLAARNVQRARDHGIPSYLAFYRKYAWLYWIWRARPAAFSPDCLRVYQRSQADSTKSSEPHAAGGKVIKWPYWGYRKAVEDMDMFPGLLSEPVFDGILPFGLNYIIGRQMRLLRDGDRFWFETDDPVTGFTPAQLREIKKMTIARVLCETTGLRRIQPHAFLSSSSRGNHEVSCDDIPTMDLKVFKQPPLHRAHA